MNETSRSTNAPALDLSSYWMPFTANRAFKEKPRLIVAAQGHHYTAADGRRIFDSFSGLWTTGLGHCHPQIVRAIQETAASFDYAPAFQIGHPAAFDVASQLCGLAPSGFTQAFFTNSGSEAVETALKLALAYHRARGEGQRIRFVGRERGYHGVNFGGISVGGIEANRRAFSGALLPAVSHLPTTHGVAENRFSRGQPKYGAERADALEAIILLHGAETIAAVIVEPVAGSTGVLVPPIGYLERLREICDRHGLLLIFDEVITAFGRVGAAFAAERFAVKPDLICLAKGVTNGAVPMGAVLARAGIYEALMKGPSHAIELFHGYTYSGHPLATAAAQATLAVYEAEQSFAQARALEADFERAIHGLDGARHVVDVRNFGLMGAIELAPRAGAPGARGLEAHVRCFEAGLMIRNGMDTLQFSPFLNSTRDEFDDTFAIVARVLASLD